MLFIKWNRRSGFSAIKSIACRIIDDNENWVSIAGVYPGGGESALRFAAGPEDVIMVLGGMSFRVFKNLRRSIMLNFDFYNPTRIIFARTE